MAALKVGIGRKRTAARVRGARVHCFGTSVTEGTGEANLRRLGRAGIADAPRTEAIAAVALARAAGIKTVRITGDHPVTAQASGREMGVLTPADDPAGVVHAGATPEDELRIVQGWEARADVVAMTGHGVDDALSVALGLIPVSIPECWKVVRPVTRWPRSQGVGAQ